MSGGNAGPAPNGEKGNPKPGPAEVMACFDMLPERLRAKVAAALFDWDVGKLLELYRLGKMKEWELIHFMDEYEAGCSRKV